MPTEGPKRHLRFAGTYNFRDAGGYPVQTGGVTRWRTLFRSDSPHRLSEADRGSLIESGLRTALDLRQSSELAEAPNVFAAAGRVAFRHLPLLSDASSMPGDLPALVDIYRAILDERGCQVRAALSVLCAPKALPAVVNCTAGKDRTGLIVALVLGLAGVPEETIVADYALSGACLSGGFSDDVLRRAKEQGLSYELLTQCDPDFMRETLEYLRRRYGGIESYARGIGLKGQEIHRLRQSMVA